MTVRYDGITHDFMMLNPLSGPYATRAIVPRSATAERSEPRSGGLDGRGTVKLVARAIRVTPAGLCGRR
jgi:hypothetical protein